MMPPKAQPQWPRQLPAIALFLLVVVAYLPTFGGDFLWDDDSNIIMSAPLRSFTGLWQIWTLPGATQQYYPLTHSSFWLDYHLWGLHPAGYHVENVLLHASTVVLLWVLLRRLRVRGAWLGAALFALHPVCVETVAWITERKNCLSGVFFMGSMLMSVSFWRLDQSVAQSIPSKFPAPADQALGPWKYYWLALVFYLCALMSKTATVPLPAVILLLIWWKRGRPGWRDLGLVAPFVAVGVGLGLITMWLEKNHLGATGGEWSFSSLQRCLIAGRAFWFYLGKLVWPHPLMFMYPRWDIAHPTTAGYAAAIAAAALPLALWPWRRKWARPVLLALGVFVVMLLPVLGFFNVVFYHYSFVCDHFQYLASIGPLALAGAAITTAAGLATKAGQKSPLQPAVSAVLLVTLGVLTWRQTGVYRSLDSLWRDTLAHNPASWMAHDNLGKWLSNQGRFDEAAVEYREAIDLNAADYMAYNDLGLDSAQQADLDSAIRYHVHALEIFPQYALGHYNLGNALARKGRLDEALLHLQRALELDPRLGAACFSMGNVLAAQGKTNEALQSYTNALQLEPYLLPAHTALGRILAAQGRVQEAIDHYRAALDIDPQSVDALTNLGNALVAMKQYDDAVAYYRKAIEIMPASAVIHYNLGVALIRMGDDANGQAEVDEARRLQAASSVKPPGPSGGGN
jgi:tetratricopeptide (TPR) repeat protein